MSMGRDVGDPKGNGRQGRGAALQVGETKACAVRGAPLGGARAMTRRQVLWIAVMSPGERPSVLPNGGWGRCSLARVRRAAASGLGVEVILLSTMRLTASVGGQKGMAVSRLKS